MKKYKTKENNSSILECEICELENYYNKKEGFNYVYGFCKYRK